MQRNRAFVSSKVSGWVGKNPINRSVPPIPISATGGSISDVTIDNVEYRVHAFTTTGSNNFEITSLGNIGNPKADILVVAGGGGGGRGTNYGGGGGGGGVIDYPGNRDNLTLSLKSETYTVTVGSGGAGQPSSAQRGSNGEDSSFIGSNISLIAKGGGGGGAQGGNAKGKDGGSGGGGGYPGGSSNDGQATQPSQSGISGTYGYGFRGGGGNSSPNGGGGGGGAGGVGQRNNPVNGGEGINLSNIWGTTFGENGYFSGGGGGSNQAGYSVPQGGNGGGGTGMIYNGTQNTNGQPNTGGGGGAGGNGDSGAKGGSGIVLIRYPISQPS